MPNVEHELMSSSKLPSTLYSSTIESLHQVHSLPVNLTNPSSPTSSYTSSSRRDNLYQSEINVRSIQSDSSLTGSLINTSTTVDNATTSIPLGSSQQLFRTTAGHSSSQQKRAIHHRRNRSGFTAVTRDRKNSFNRVGTTKAEEQQSNALCNQQPTAPFVRDIKAILNEHLTMINNLLTNHSFDSVIQCSIQNSSIRDFRYRCLHALSLEYPMKQRCSKTETKMFIDSIVTYHMNRSYHYQYLIDNVRNLVKSLTDRTRSSTCSSEAEDGALRSIMSVVDVVMIHVATVLI
jgi:hypothetical protein